MRPFNAQHQQYRIFVIYFTLIAYPNNQFPLKKRIQSIRDNDEQAANNNHEGTKRKKANAKHKEKKTKRRQP